MPILELNYIVFSSDNSEIKMCVSDNTKLLVGFTSGHCHACIEDDETKSIAVKDLHDLLAFHPDTFLKKVLGDELVAQKKVLENEITGLKREIAEKNFKIDQLENDIAVLRKYNK